MVKKKVLWWQIGGFIFSVALGSIFHFLYQWTGKNIIVASFSAVNESTFEHMKILFFPTFIFAVVESFFLKEIKSFWSVKFVGVILATLLIPAFFYTLNGIFGTTPPWINILLFISSSFLGFSFEYSYYKKDRERKGDFLGFIPLFLIALLFVIFTYYPPKLPLFLDPVTNTYGIG